MNILLWAIKNFPLKKKNRWFFCFNYIPEIQKRKSTDVLGTLHPTSFKWMLD